MKKLFSYIFLLSFAATAIAQGASFSISPLGSVLTVPPGAKAPQEVYTLVNPGSQPVSVETVVMTWGQGPKGEALYEESKDFVVYPRIIELKPGATRTVRVLPRGISADNLAGRQAYYRVQFTELTKKQDLAAEAGSRVFMSTRILVPLVVQAESFRPSPQFDLVADKEGFRVRNTGDSLVKISELRCQDRRLQGLTYVQPGKSFLVSMPKGGCASPITVLREGHQPVAIEISPN